MCEHSAQPRVLGVTRLSSGTQSELAALTLLLLSHYGNGAVACLAVSNLRVASQYVYSTVLCSRIPVLRRRPSPLTGPNTQEQKYRGG